MCYGALRDTRTPSRFDQDSGLMCVARPGLQHPCAGCPRPMHFAARVTVPSGGCWGYVQGRALQYLGAEQCCWPGRMPQLAIQTQQRRVQHFQEAGGSAAAPPVVPLRQRSEGKPERSTARKFKTSMQQRGAREGALLSPAGAHNMQPCSQCNSMGWDPHTAAAPVQAFWTMPASPALGTCRLHAQRLPLVLHSQKMSI
jgi:hypothetical protein